VNAAGDRLTQHRGGYQMRRGVCRYAWDHGDGMAACLADLTILNGGGYKSVEVFSGVAGGVSCLGWAARIPRAVCRYLMVAGVASAAWIRPGRVSMRERGSV
jgi:hypothetical protein